MVDNGNKKINFYKAQKDVRWMKFPFKHSQVQSILDKGFEPDTWYKLSHFYPKQYEMDVEIYICVEPDGNLKTYQIF